MEQLSKPGLWRFGAAELDERLATLRVAGNPVELDRSSYDILLALLRHAGEVVTKDELLEAGWPGRVVSENSLAKAVSRLRQALGDDAGSLRVVHGYGYRLAAAVNFAPVAADTVEAVPHEAARLREGDRLPHRPGWRLGRRLGEGAAGVIFLAVADSGETRAVKLATSETGLRGLKREIALSRYIQSVRGAQAPVVPVLGWNLSHPPFFLELPFHSEGSLRDWATFRGGLASVPRSERLALAVQLCEAVAALHAIGVIHRDLKPENLYPVADASVPGGWRIVLGDLGASDAASSPLLAELGITMSLLDTAREGASSRYGGSVLYIAPEVIAGDMPTQRSDLFALGVLVYQLAIGDLRRSLAPGWESAIDDELLRGDIALAAAADPDRRIGDAHALAERLRALVERHAALAASRVAERQHRQQAADFARMARRRRLLLAGSGALAVFLGMSLWQQHRTDAAREVAVQAAARAETEAAKAQRVTDFLTDDVMRQADPYSGSAGAQTLRQAIDRAAGDVDRRFQADPDVAAAIHGTLGAAYEGMNDYAAATRHFQRQVALLRTAAGASPDGGILAAVARAQSSLCAARHWLGDLPQAEADCLRARADHLRAGLEPDHPEVFMALGESRHGRYRATLAKLEPRLERLRAAGDHELYGLALWFAAIAEGRLGRHVEAERTYARLVQVRRAQAGARGKSMQLAWALCDHGGALLLVGEATRGRAQLEESARMFGELGGRDHPHRQAPLIRLARHELALGHWRKARDLAQPAYAALLPATSWQNWTIYAALAAMRAHARLGDEASARAIMAAFDEMAMRGLDRDFPYLREDHWTGYAATWLALGEPSRARADIERLRSLLREPDASQLLPAKLDCFDAELALAAGDAGAARRLARRCHERYAAALPASSPLLAWPARLLSQAGSAPAGNARAAAP
jgi:non-specific serine/threonine protein kinase